MPESAVLAHHGARDELARSVWFTGALLTFLATGEETGGRFALGEELFRKGVTNLAPMHVHSREESFYVL